MRYEAVFFDFDGTLVDSAAAKKQAFFALFPDTESHAAIVRAVLAADPDGSRHRVIPRIVEAMRAAGLAADADAGDLTARYARSALEAVSAAPELPGATRLLDALVERKLSAYLCSNTPRDDLLYLVAQRRWLDRFEDIAGYPEAKESFVRRTLDAGSLSPGKAVYIGDGASDRAAAQSAGIEFRAVHGPRDLRRIAEAVLDADV